MTNSEQARMNDLELYIELTPSQERELTHLRTLAPKTEQHFVAVDSENDPDPDCIASRMKFAWSEQYHREQRRNRRNCQLIEQAYAEQSKRMNALGFSH